MKIKKRYLTVAGLLVLIGVIVGLGISSSFNFFTPGYSVTPIPQEDIELLARIDKATADLAEAVRPSVVNVSSTTTVRMRETASPFFNDPFFRDFFGDRFRDERPRKYKQFGLGSGVIVDSNGYILTNFHVVKGAEEIKVILSDQKSFKGKVVGKDPRTDLAVIKIDASGLPAIAFGDSDKLRVGMRAIAIGNPFGLNQTVTTGVISATGRANVGIADYEDFIQTDAPINPGNSGGALINARGELIGINTAIISSTGGYQGIGFAIPSNMAKLVMTSLIKNGRIVRGWMGVSVQHITPELARQFGLKADKGVLVSEVAHNSPAEEAGLKSGDVIAEFDGKEIDSPAGLRNSVANTAPGKTVAVKYIRNGQAKSAQVKIRELPEALQPTADADNNLQGVTVMNLTPDIRRALNIPERVTGVIVSDIEENSPAGDVLMEGDVIRAVNKTEIRNLNDYQSVVTKIKPGQKILLLVFRRGEMVYLTL